MTRPYAPKVITANALVSGEVVYLTADDRWSPDLSEAEVLEDEAHAALREIEAAARAAEVVGVYLFEVRHGPRGPEPVHFREAFRATGPSNRFHGKQAEAAPRPARAA
ncbi:MAG: DUF2849 domain-containing protein [Rhodobacteraceae bacterium]|nr:DUF2849 domain-containing protein [Paracoccaceae bacterium]